MATQTLITVLNPEAERTPATEGSGAGVPSWAMAPRLDSLNGKTVYLVNQGFGGSDLFMEQFQAWFAENMPTVKTVLKRKTGFIFQGRHNGLVEGNQGEGRCGHFRGGGLTRLRNGGRRMLPYAGTEVWNSHCAPFHHHILKVWCRKTREYFGVPLRFMYTPHPVASMKPAVLRGYIEGQGSGNRKAAGRRSVGGAYEAIHGGREQEPRRRASHAGAAAVLEADTEDSLQASFHRARVDRRIAHRSAHGRARRGDA